MTIQTNSHFSHRIQQLANKFAALHSSFPDLDIASTEFIADALTESLATRSNGTSNMQGMLGVLNDAEISSSVDASIHAMIARPFTADINPAALLSLGQVLRRSGYRFTTVSPATHHRVLARSNYAWGESATDIFGWSRPFRFDVSADVDADSSFRQVLPLFALMRAAGILQSHGEGWRTTVRLSSCGEQLYFHSSYPTTEPDAVFFGPDTHRFVRALQMEPTVRMDGNPIQRVADIGCGAGVAAIELSLRLPKAEVYAVDINEAALTLTAINAKLAGAHNVVTRNSDLLTEVEGQFDLIVANPPYLLDQSALTYRHGGGDLGEGISLAIVQAAIERLARGGTLLLYTGVAIVDGVDPFMRVAGELLNRAGMTWTYEEIDADVFGEELDNAVYRKADRIAAVWLKAYKLDYLTVT